MPKTTMAPIFWAPRIFSPTTMGIGRMKSMTSVIMLDTAVAMYRIPASMHVPPAIVKSKAFRMGLQWKNMRRVRIIVYRDTMTMLVQVATRNHFCGESCR